MEHKVRVVQSALGKYCHEYRVSIGASLRDVAGEVNVKNVSSFEHGRSSHVKYLLYYGRLADVRGEYDLFIDGFRKTLKTIIEEMEMKKDAVE